MNKGAITIVDIIGKDELSMDDIMNWEVKSLEEEGEDCDLMNISFRKMVKTKEYENETYSIDMELKVPKSYSGYKRALARELLQAQLEYMVYMDLVFRGSIDTTEFETRRNMIIILIKQLAAKCR